MRRERRQAPRRVVVHGRILLDTPWLHSAEIVDVSADGVCVATPHAIDIGSSVCLTSASNSAGWWFRRGIVIHVRGAILGISMRSPLIRL